MSTGKTKWYKYLDPFFPYDKLIDFLKKKKLSNKYSDFIIFILYALILAYLILKILALILGAHEAMMIVVSGSMEHYLNIGDIVVLHSPKTINTTYIDLNFAIQNRPIYTFITPRYYILDDVNKQNLSFDQVIAYFETHLNKNNPNLNIYLQDLNVDGQIVIPDFNADVVVYYSDSQQKEIIHRAILGIHALDGTYYLTKGDNPKTNFQLDAYCVPYKYNCLYPYALQKENVLSRYFFKIPYLGWVKLGPSYLLGWRP